MNGQLNFFSEEEQPKDNCYACKHFSELKEPREGEGFAIYGYCFKFGNKVSSINEGKGYPVYIPEGKCKDYKRKKGNKNA